MMLEFPWVRHQVIQNYQWTGTEWIPRTRQIRTLTLREHAELVRNYQHLLNKFVAQERSPDR